MKLYCFGESGHSYKVALALTLSGTKWQAEHVDFFNGAARSDDYKENINEMGECPVLVDGDHTLSQSGVILDYLSDKTGKFGGETADDKREVLRWILWDNHKFSAMIGMTRFLLNFLSEKHRPAEVIAFNQGRIKSAMAVLDTHLTGRDFVVGRNVTNADISLCSYLYYPETCGVDVAQYPNIVAWLDRIKALPNWQAPYDLMQPAFQRGQ
ncbi:glutathione S-transferase family protein [Aestuariibius sp. HNIBRBA575]|uniref:glutathione S-transferase family protein n=1 Tax=Aestuariibius sp. HNIBRBA575 TaxID=3233343 RepID=UPI0034A4E7F3